MSEPKMIDSGESSEGAWEMWEFPIGWRSQEWQGRYNAYGGEGRDPLTVLRKFPKDRHPAPNWVTHPTNNWTRRAREGRELRFYQLFPAGYVAHHLYPKNEFGDMAP